MDAKIKDFIHSVNVFEAALLAVNINSLSEAIHFIEPDKYWTKIPSAEKIDYVKNQLLSNIKEITRQYQLLMKDPDERKQFFATQSRGASQTQCTASYFDVIKNKELVCEFLESVGTVARTFLTKGKKDLFKALLKAAKDVFDATNSMVHLAQQLVETEEDRDNLSRGEISEDEFRGKVGLGIDVDIKQFA